MRKTKRKVWPWSLWTVGAITLGVAILGAVLIVIGLDWWQTSETACKSSGLACDLSVHVVGTGIVFVLSFALIFLRREGQAAAAWRRTARRHPEQLLRRWLPPEGGVTGLAIAPVPTRREDERKTKAGPHLRLRRRREAEPSVSLLDHVVTRDQLIQEIADDLDGGPGKQLLVGPTGSGKTIVLLMLAPLLARQGLVPIAFSLREAHDPKDIDFERMAQEAYRREFPRRTDEEADKQWRWLIRGGQIVMLIDDLEKAAAAPQDVAVALEELGSRFRVIAATRRNGIPPNYKRGRIDLEALDPEAVGDDLVRRVQKSARDEIDDEEAREIVSRIVAAAEIPQTPYYFAIAQVLAGIGELPDVSLEGVPRLNLLLRYRAALETGALRLDASLDRQMRQQVLRGLEWIAFLRMTCLKTGAQVEPRLRELLADDYEALLGKDFSAQATIEYGKRLGLLDAKSDTVIRFGHPTTMAFFASCLLYRYDTDPRLWDAVLKAETFGTETSLACVFAHGQIENPIKAAGTCLRLMDRLQESEDGSTTGLITDPGKRILVLKTALEIVISSAGQNVPPEEIDRVVRAAANERRREGLAREQLELLRDVARLKSQEKNETLWKFASDAVDYRVGREATRLLREAPADWMVERIDKVLAEVKRFESEQDCPVDEDRGALFGDLRAAALTLPGLRSRSLKEETRDRLRQQQDTIHELAWTLTKQLSLEVAIADGLKRDAVNNPDAAPDSVACQMLSTGSGRARFWFSRVLLLQAVARRCIDGPEPGRARKLIELARRDPHPFVRQTAELCGQAMESGSWRPYIWEDMTEIAAGTGSSLALPTRQLIGEIALALNMNEHGDAQARIRFGASNRLPRCLTKSADRHEILGKAKLARCPFASNGHCLCPYTYHRPGDGIRRELSRAFCRDQRRNAEGLPHSSIDAKELRDFWQEMEYLARF